MNFENDKLFGCEFKLSNDILNPNIYDLFEPVEESVSISKPSFVDEFRFEEIIYKKLRINIKNSHFEKENKEELNYKEDNPDFHYDDTTQAILIFDIPDLSLFEDDKKIVDEELQLKDKNTKDVHVEDTPIEEESSIVETKVEKEIIKRRQVSRDDASNKDVKNTRFGKKED